DAVARAAARRGRPRARPLLDAAARAHGRARRAPLRNARGGRRAGDPLLRVRLPALGLRRSSVHASPAAGAVARAGPARQRRGALRGTRVSGWVDVGSLADLEAAGRLVARIDGRELGVVLDRETGGV